MTEYAYPEVLVANDWLAAHLTDPGTLDGHPLQPAIASLRSA
jgi:hypothetical protein